MMTEDMVADEDNPRRGVTCLLTPAESRLAVASGQVLSDHLVLDLAIGETNRL
jgi:hypothetical protein